MSVANNLAPGAEEEPPPPGRSAWWVLALSRLPMPLLYAFSAFLAFLAFRVFPYRVAQVRESMALAFPDVPLAEREDYRRRYYQGFADMFVEIVKAATLSQAQIRERVGIANVEAVRAHLDAGQSVLLVAAHQCNWEWMLLALSLELGYPLDAAYKPLVDSWAEREMLKIRSRFGGRLIEAKTMLGDIIRRRAIVRAIAMVADQEPVTSERKHWTRFLNRDTAFYMGPEEIARVTRFPVLFVAMRRLARGRYEMEFQPLAAAREALQPGELTERYVRLVEAQIRAAPPDWPWSHKRWRLKKPLYGSG